MPSIHLMHIYGVPTASWQGEGGLGWSVGKEHNGKEELRKPLEKQRGR